MVVYSERSQKCFDELDPRLQRVLLYIKDVLQIDHAIIQGYRGEEDQNAAFASGASQLRYPQSKHNRIPAAAVDVIPYIRLSFAKGGVHWHNEDPLVKEAYYRDMVRLATIIQLVARLIFNLELRWGGDWDRDWTISDNKFNDFPHLEIAD